MAAGGWRLALLSGLAAGLAVSPFWSPAGGLLEAAVALVLILVVLIDRSRLGAIAAVPVVLAAILVGAGIGGLRIDSIDRGALAVRPGTDIEIRGFTAAPAKRSRGLTRVPVETGAGKILVEAGSAPAPIGTGTAVIVSGVARGPPDYLRSTVRRQGMSMVLHAERIDPVNGVRGGLQGWIDGLRNRAEAALERGMPDREAALARGFVLGQDDSIDPKTTEDFQASGLAHLLAVSGQNVVLLGLLAIPFMAIAGLRPGTRLVVVAGLIAIYVPLAGAGASIQRAGVMGLAGLLAVAAARPASRLFALALAAAVTLVTNPRAAADVGWQLSFAAVIGIYLLFGPLRARLAVLIGSGGWREGLCDAAAVTVAATVATAPLMAFHFDQVSATTLLANLLAFPAVAPAMWLGMISAAVGQIATAVALPFNLLNSLLLAYVAQVAAWLGGPSWTRLEIGLSSPGELAIAYLVLAAAFVTILRLVTPQTLGLDAGPWHRRRARWLTAAALVSITVAGFLVGPGLLNGERRHLGDPPDGGVRIEVLDVGQGDAILIRPGSGDPVLVDGGPPGGDLIGALESAEVERLEAVLLTHPDLDHKGGLYELFSRIEVERFFFDWAPADLRNVASESGAALERLAAGQMLTLGRVRLEVLWPPPRTPDMLPPEDPNTRSLATELTLGDFGMLLTGDAEGEAAPVDSGPVDVLQVAHHGSDDAGLPARLDSTDPSLAIISAGEGNPFGHPTRGTIEELIEAGTAILRTDQDGTISIVVDGNGFTVETGR